MWRRPARRPLDLYVLYRSLALTWAFVPFQVLYLQAQGLSLAAIFDLNVVFSLATVVLEVPTGVFADRRGRRVAMACGGIAMALACAFFLIGGSFGAYALANVLCALSMTLSSGADSAYLYDYLAESGRAEMYPRYEGLATAAKGVGNLVAVLLGGVIYSVAPRGVFVLTAILTSVASVLALALPERAVAARPGAAAQDLARAWRVLVTDGKLIATLAFGALTFVLLRLSLFADQPHLELHLGALTGIDVALAASLLAAAKEVGGALMASASGGLLRRVRVGLLAPALATFAVATYAVMGLGAGWPCVAAMVLLASSFGLFSPLMRSMMNRLIPSSRDRATLLSFESMARRVLFALASPLFGRAAEASSLHASFTGTAFVAVGCYVALAALAWGVFRGRRPASTIRVRQGSALASAAG